MNSFWNFFWLVIEIFVFFAYLMVLFHVLVDIFRDRTLSGGFKALWIIGLVFIPVITALIYLIARGRGMAEREHARAASAQQRTEGYLRDVVGRSAATEIADAKALLESGTITQEEFEQLKRQALGAPSGQPVA
ncbi:putative oligomerization/nucleic acid binding protein [Antricoccus suffuscus]|uniref:Putative oligomerization/nucleic acid binding protein n=1 Tax=Antricoccus suffuscus TaxID=1629062 RepID=A0A2T1A656_9ACTN|nr:SHOCT domain-containing protein [Antricoccus suffuscus]PRZ44095.1 putative oligomerization/nucleic acid binding protein [Antricoccus suffuscus]